MEPILLWHLCETCGLWLKLLLESRGLGLKRLREALLLDALTKSIGLWLLNGRCKPGPLWLKSGWKNGIDTSRWWALLERHSGWLRLEGWSRICKRASCGISIDIGLLELPKLLWLLEARGLWNKTKLTKPLVLRNEPGWLALQLQLLKLLLQSLLR